MLWALLLGCLLLVLSDGFAYANTGGAQQIETSVPCTVTLVIGEHGSVAVDGTRYVGDGSFQRDVGTVVTYSIESDDGYEISKVAYGLTDVTFEAKDGTYRAEPLEGNVRVAVTFSKVTDGSSRLQSSSQLGKSSLSRGATSALAQTSDRAHLGFPLSLLILFGSTLMVLGVIGIWNRGRVFRSKLEQGDGF